MDKDQIIEEFFRSLRVTLTNASAYSKDHPYFVKSVENFKLKLEEIFTVLNPFKIGVTSLGLIFDGTKLVRVGLYDELAHQLHRRKIKSIEIRSQATLTELVGFFSIISMAQKDIFKNGGVKVLLEKNQLLNFSVEELDYSELLHAQGQECTDIWGYMLKEAVYSNDEVRMDQLADTFGSFIKRVDVKDLSSAEGVSTEVNEFLISLRNKNKEKFDKCLNDVFLWLLHNKKTVNQDNVVKLNPAFAGLSQEDFFALLKEGFLQEDNFDSLSLQLFSKISDQKDSSQITKDFFSKIGQTQGVKESFVAVKKVQNLLDNSKDDNMSAVYRNTLDSLVKNVSSFGNLTFDRKILRENYLYILLSVLATDENIETLQIAAGILQKESASLFENNDLGLLKDLFDVLAKRKKEAVEVCVDLEKCLSSFVENMILNSGLTPQQEFLQEMVILPSEGVNSYLDKIFGPLEVPGPGSSLLTELTVEKVNKQILDLFLRLFPDSMEAFYKRLEKKIHDTEFFGSLIAVLSQIDMSVTLRILERIYLLGNEVIKLESLKAMHKLKKVDTAFIMCQLNTDSFLLRSQLISALMLDEQAKNVVLDILFKIPSFLGSKNNLLIENMEIARKLKIMEAVSCIKNLSHSRFFWNYQLRKKAIQILKEWNVY